MVMSPTSPAFVLPDLVGAVAGASARVSGSFLRSRIEQVLARNCPPSDVRQYLQKLRIRTCDARLTFDFTCTGTRLPPAEAKTAPISPSAPTPRIWCARPVAKKTLTPCFFNRRLSMTG